MEIYYALVLMLLVVTTFAEAVVIARIAWKIYKRHRSTAVVMWLFSLIISLLALSIAPMCLAIFYL